MPNIIANQLLPVLASYDYEALREDIARRGILVPVLVNALTGEIIDGHHRKQIADELGIDCPMATVEMESEEAETVAISLNIKRRRLSLEQRREIAAELNARAWTQARIADALGVAQSTVAAWLGEATIISSDNGCLLDARAKLSSEEKQAVWRRYQDGETQTQLAADFGVTRQAIGKVLEAMRKKLAHRANIDRQQEEIAAGAVTPPNGLFEVVVMDPPWAYGREYDPDGSRVANPYPEMDQDALLELDPPLAADSVLFLWTTHRFLPDAFDLINEWNLTYKATLVWDKESLGMGSWLRMQCEFCLVAISGNPHWDNTTWRDIIHEKRREHSRKPEAFYQMVEAITAGHRIDYFSRESRHGWDQYGNNTSRFK